MNEYVITHTHTQETNGVIVEVPSSLKDYLEEIKKKDGIKGLIVTNHGNKLGWFKHYQLMKKYGHKYVHAVEGYACLNGDDKFNKHILLYSTNYNGFEEINELISTSYQRDGHFYKRPRMFIDEILKCKNIIISTACSGGIFAESKEEDKENSDIVKAKILEWGLENKDRLFLEIQPHIYNKQILVNNEVLKLHRQGYNIICSNDVHYTNNEFKEIRKIISMDKNSGEEFELVFDLSIKSYEEQLKGFVNLGIDKSIAEEALANTVKLYDMCEEYEIDCSTKYPNLYDNPKESLMEMAIEKLYKLDYITNDDISKYLNRITTEMDTIEHLNALSYINLFSDWLTWCRERGIAIGFGRGSASSGLVNYLTNITGVDSIVWDTNFDRFMNKAKRANPDIDVDIEPDRRQEARSWFFNHPKLNCSDILTFGTVAYKGACDTIIRTSELTKQQGEQLKEMYADIRTEFELSDSDLFREKLPISIDELAKRMGDYGDLIRKVVLLEGCTVSIGSHPAGVLVTDLDIRKKIGIITMEDKETGDYKLVSQCDMKELDYMGYVKADALGLSTVGAINKTVKYLGQEFPEPQHFDFYDEKVWEDIKKSPCMIFQFEETKAHDYMKVALDLVDIDKKLYTMSMMSGLIRPSGKTVRDSFLRGEKGGNGHIEVDNMFPNTSGKIVYQEDITKFLVEFCGYDYQQSDYIRKCLHEDTEIYLSDGTRKKIKDIEIGDEVVSLNNNTYKIEHKKVTNKWYNGKKYVNKITTNHNKVIYATDEHKILTEYGYMEVKDIKEGIYLYTNKNNLGKHDGLKGNQRIPFDITYMIGLLIGDGTIGGENLSFTNNENILIEAFKKGVSLKFKKNYIDENDFRVSSIDGITVDKIYVASISNEIKNKSMKEFIKKLEINCKSGDKKIPTIIKKYGDTKPLHGIIAGLFNTDGYVNTQSSTIEYASKSEVLVNDIYDCLLKLGIYSYISKKYVKGYDYYMSVLRICNEESYREFELKILPYILGEKYNKYKDIIELNKNLNTDNGYLLPTFHTNEIDNAVLNSKHSFSHDFGIMEYKSGFNKTKNKAEIISRKLYVPETYKLLLSDLIPIKIKKIEKVKKIANVYDIEVEDNHNFIADGIVVHNCISKKQSDDVFMPMMKKIELDFMNYFPKHYKATDGEIQNVLKSFLDIVKSSQMYGFCYSHAIAYTMYGYIGAYYRYYNTIEYCTANLNEFNGKPDKLKEIYHFINNFTEIKIINPIYPVCKLDYTYDKENNIVYEGMLGAKGVGKNVEIAFSSVDNNIKFNSIKEFIIYIKENEIGINKRELVTLNKMKFFRGFGSQNKNEKTILAMFGEKTIHPSRFKYDKKATEKTKTKKLADLDLLLETIPYTDFNPLLQAFYDLEVFGHTPQRFDNMNEVYYVIDCKKPYSKYIIDLYNVGTGEKVTYKGKDIKKPVKQNLIQILNRELKPDYYVCGEHSDGKPKFLTTGTKSWNITEYKYIDPDNGNIIEKPKKELDKE